MKTYEETAQYILEVRNEHDKKIKRRKALAMRIIPAAAGICCAVVICLAAVKNYRKPIDMITDDSIITNGSISIVTTAPHGTEEAVTTVISDIKTTVRTTAQTTVSATSVTSTKAAATAGQTYAQTANAVTAAITPAVYTTIAPTSLAAMTTTIETITTIVTTQDITAGPVITGGDNGEGGGFGGGGGGGSTDAGGISGENIGEEWNQRPINEKYCYAYIYGYNRVYNSLYMISPEYVGEWIDSAEMLSGQMVAGQQMKCAADVYSVNGITDAGAVAIKFEENEGYYLYYKPDADLYKIIQTVPQA